MTRCFCVDISRNSLFILTKLIILKRKFIIVIIIIFLISYYKWFAVNYSYWYLTGMRHIVIAIFEMALKKKHFPQGVPKIRMWPCSLSRPLAKSNKLYLILPTIGEQCNRVYLGIMLGKCVILIHRVIQLSLGNAK